MENLFNMKKNKIVVIEKKVNIPAAGVRGDGDIMTDNAGTILVADKKRNELLYNYRLIKNI